MKPHLVLAAAFALSTTPISAQDAPGNGPTPPQGEQRPGEGRGGRGGFGGPGMGPMRQEMKVLEKFDANGDKMLDATERKPAREFIAKERAEGRGGRGPGMRPPGGPDGRPPENAGGPPGGDQGGPGRGGPGGFGGPGRGFGRANRPPAQPGPKVSPADVPAAKPTPLYSTDVLRTFFIDFENEDWEKELADFRGTDVEVPATLTVDGKKYENVGIHFRGASSYMMVPEGYKRSLNLSLDFVKEKQDLRGFRTLNLLNSNGDPTMMRAVLYSEISRQYIPAPRANWVRVVINGESWGVYVNVEQFNKDFTEHWWGSKKGARWKAPGSPNGRSGLEYLGDDVAKYKERFEIKTKDVPESWNALIELCRVLNQTPAAELEAKLAPIFDIEGALRFLALENVFINEDGYWVRASDYSLYRDESGVFHIVPHDMNETFTEARGPGMNRGGGGGSGLSLDPLASVAEERKPVLSKLLAVPALRTRYLAHVREMSETWLKWEKLSPLVEQYSGTIAEAVKTDTRKLASTEAFQQGISVAPSPAPEPEPEAAGAPSADRPERRGPRRALSIKEFADRRREFLAGYFEKSAASAP